MALNVRVDLDGEGSPFPHYYEHCVGSGHAALALRADYREQLSRVHRECGFEYVRFHAVFSPAMNVMTVDRRFETGERVPTTNFDNVDSIYDFLLSIGMRPFVELSFMPDLIAEEVIPHFHYRGNVSRPKRWEDWGGFVEEFARHLVERYGGSEVRTWPFEVWNEPNLRGFWPAGKDAYMKLYEHAARAVKEADDEIAVGGPASARNEWITDLREYCRERGVPLDFISTHHYPTDVALLKDEKDFQKQLEFAPRGALTEMCRRARQEAGSLPLYYTEWSTSPSPRDDFHDENLPAPFVAKTLIDNQGLVDGYSYWAFSDIFEESGMLARPFHGGFGMLTARGTAKPVYRAFELMHRAGDVRLPVECDPHPTIEAAAFRKAREDMVLLYNSAMPYQPIEGGEVEVTLKGVAAGRGLVLLEVNPGDANPKAAWREMGGPDYLTDAQVVALEEASRAKESLLTVGEGSKLTLSLPEYGLAAIIIPK